MQPYKVLVAWDVPQTIIEKDLGLADAHYDVGAIVELPEADAAELVAAGTLELVQPPTQGPFSVTVSWTDGAAQADIDAATPFIAELTAEVNGPTATDVPTVIDSILIKRL